MFLILMFVIEVRCAISIGDSKLRLKRNILTSIEMYAFCKQMFCNISLHKRFRTGAVKLAICSFRLSFDNCFTYLV